jgi:hypothetical protein
MARPHCADPANGCGIGPSKVSSAEGDDQPTAGRKIYSPTVYIPLQAAVLSILNGMTGTPAYVRNARLDILAANDFCLALYDGVRKRSAAR